MNSEELPIFKASYDLLEKMMDLSKELPKFFRYTIGTRLVDLCLDMLGQIYRANMSMENRRKELEELIVCYRQLQMLLRVCYRQKAFSSGRYAVYIQLLDSIGRQATAWKNKMDNEK